MRYYPQDSMVVSRAKNGIIVQVPGTREEQEDRQSNYYVFSSASEFAEWVEERLKETEQ